MNAADLPLDPLKHPFQTELPMLLSFLDVIDRLISNGLAFDVIETHFGNTCVHDLRNIVKWTRRDLSRQEIDFTSKYQSAREYSDCWQGSQLKQNFKYISTHILERKQSSEFADILRSTDLTIIEQVYHWLTITRDNSAPIVIWVQRSLDFFKESQQLLPLGSFQTFLTNFRSSFDISDIHSETLDHSTYLPDDSSEFYCSLTQPLDIRYITKTEYL